MASDDLPGRLGIALVALLGCQGDGDEAKKTSAAAAKDAAPAAVLVPRESMGEAIPAAPPLAPPPRGLPPLPDGPFEQTAAKVELGALLFFEPRLSATSTRSCAGCHQPARGWADGEARSTTVAGKPNLRHTPTLFNVGWHRTWAWDGSMQTLEAQILTHWEGQLGGAPEVVAAALSRSPGYVARFQRVFEAAPARERVAEALAAYVRSLSSGDSPWDRHEAGERGAVGSDAIDGFAVFSERAGCAVCHPPPLYTDHGFHARAGAGADQADPGRARVTADAADQGAFKTPGLRGLVHTAPYFHDGSAATLDAAVDAELARGSVALDANQRRQLLAFLAALSPPLEPVPPPELPAIP